MIDTTMEESTKSIEMGEKAKNLKELSIEEILPHVGEFGLFQILLSLCFGLVLFATSPQPVIGTFIALTPTWRCVGNSSECYSNETFSEKNEARCNMRRTSWEYTTKDSKFSLVTQFELDCDRKYLITVIMAIFFVGWMVGGIICGSVTDRFGRRVTFIPCVATTLVLGFMSPFVNSIVVIIIFRFLMGCAYPGILIQSTVLLTEFTGNTIRPFATGLPNLCVNLGWIVLGLKANYLPNWKNLSMVCTAPYIFVLLFYFFIPESARWLHLNNRNEEALKVLRNIAKWNKRILSDDITLPSNCLTVTVSKSSLLHLYNTRSICVQSLVIMFLWISIGLQAYGLQFAASDLGYSVYLNFVLLAAAGLPSGILAAFSTKIFGLKASTLTLFALGSIMCFAIAPLPNKGLYKVARLLLGIFGKLFATATFTCLYVWTPEIYSTNMRAAAMGVVQVSARIGSGISPVVVKLLHGWKPFVVIGVVSIAAAGLGFLLPETKGRQLKEGPEDDG